MTKSDINIGFDDVLIKPQYSTVRSRSDVDLSTNLSESLSLSMPILAANMDTVCEYPMAAAMNDGGGIGVLHRNMIHSKRIACVRRLSQEGRLSAVAFGVNEILLPAIKRHIDSGIDMIVLDIAHGDSAHALDAVESIRSYVDGRGADVCIVGGNVATAGAVYRMRSAGAHCVKVGIGPGAACLTRVNTGVGIPQLSAIIECAEVADSLGMSSIADGGLRNVGDIAKALAAGADAVMLGSMLAGTDESPGDHYDIDGKEFKGYRGMASADAGSSYIEGASGYVPYVGSVSGVLESIRNGLSSALSYSGAANLSEFRAKSQFVRVSVGAIAENGAHGV
jgi:IMP dehydrogenase